MASNYAFQTGEYKKPFNNQSLASLTSSDSLRNNSLQDRFLSVCISEQILLDLFLQSDSSQRGVIEAFDNWVILFHAKQRYYLIYKTAIALPTPVEPDKVEALMQSDLSYAFQPARVVLTLEERMAKYRVKSDVSNNKKQAIQFLALKQTLSDKLHKSSGEQKYNSVA